MLKGSRKAKKSSRPIMMYWIVCVVILSCLQQISTVNKKSNEDEAMIWDMLPDLVPADNTITLHVPNNGKGEKSDIALRGTTATTTSSMQEKDELSSKTTIDNINEKTGMVANETLAELFANNESGERSSGPIIDAVFTFVNGR